MSSIIDQICRKHDLVITSQFSAGNICKTVYKVVDSQHKSLVLKLSIDERTKKEIFMNRKGYENIHNIGIDWFVPKNYFSGEIDGNLYDLMEYCGEDFVTQTKKHNHPINLFNYLISEIKNVYEETLVNINNGNKILVAIVNKIVDQYEKYIFSDFDPQRSFISTIEEMKKVIALIKAPKCCFSNWDFTPEDVYLSSTGIKYTDPHEDILGIPIVDLACFAGVARDVYKLPGAVGGYDFIKQFAITDLAKQLLIDEITASKIFYLGRILQSFLSIRFRKKESPLLAKKIFEQSKIYFTRVIL